MARKTFIAAAALIGVVFLVTTAIKYGQPDSATNINFDSFPLEKGDWSGYRDDIPGYVVDLLHPIDIFSATYTNGTGEQVHLLFDFFSGSGGPHSPRNCLPGSGWTLLDHESRQIEFDSDTITVYRFRLGKGDQSYVMDFWYVTPLGETANDFVFKLHELATSLAFLPRHVAFIRIVAARTPAGLAALDDFERLFVPEIYALLPFNH